MDKKRPPSMNALAKRIGHPKWTEAGPILDIIERAVSHEFWYKTKIMEGAAEAIVDRIVDMPPLKEAGQLERANTLLAKLVQRRSFAALGFPASGGIGMIVARECERNVADLPWTSSIIENTSNGIGVVAQLNPQELETWLKQGKLTDKTALRIAVRYTRNIRTLAKRIDDENGKRKTMAEARVTVELSVLEKISTRVEGDPQTWRRLAQKIDVQSLDDFTRLERKYDGDYPNLRSGLTRALLHGMKREAVSSNSNPGRTPRL